MEIGKGVHEDTKLGEKRRGRRERKCGRRKIRGMNVTV